MHCNCDGPVSMEIFNQKIKFNKMIWKADFQNCVKKRAEK